MSDFSIRPEEVRSGATALFDASEAIYEAMNTLAEDSSALEGTPEATEFTGIAECLKAAEVWESDYIAVHRADIEETAKFAAVCAETGEEVDDYGATMFDQYADVYLDDRTAPSPERPGPDPAAQIPRGESLAV
ncbi:hypothetical protein [Glycomyces xiaoerkulensis]|uniref:hypothetical protein n=1 Tax=Glycomyces xiaoerkulensis TaxID=2038139 RepID=UPI000C26AEE2|nr:hypothetical protein [Glycomyces xiaoerkulensis]